MANTIATATGSDRTGRTKETHRLGSESAYGRAATWHTDARAFVRADGSGSLMLLRDGLTIVELTFGPETGAAGEHVAGSPRTVAYRLGVGSTLIGGEL